MEPAAGKLLKITLIFIVLGGQAVLCFCIWSQIPGYTVAPPERMFFPQRSLWKSKSHPTKLFKVVLWIPVDSSPEWKEFQNIISLLHPLLFPTVKVRGRLSSPSCLPKKTPGKKQLCEAGRARTRTAPSTHLLCNLSIAIIQAKYSWTSAQGDSQWWIHSLVHQEAPCPFQERRRRQQLLFHFPDPMPHNMKYTFSTQN